MQVPIERSFNHLTSAETSRANTCIDRRVAKLERLVPDAISCHIAVSRPQEHQRSGTAYRAVVRLTLPPNKLLVASKDPHNSDALDVSTILREAFDAVERQLEKASAQRHGHP